MRLVSLDSKELKRYAQDPEMLQKSRRPCALIVKLKYQGCNYDFAVPLRSNIAPSAPKDQYFPLPPRPSTKDGHHHGVHYIKMFPVDRHKVHKFHTDGIYYSLIKAILDKNEKEIVSSCQQYLDRYSRGDRPQFSTDIDLLLDVLDV